MAKKAPHPFIFPKGWRPPKREFVMECRKLVMDFFPEAIDKLEGLIEGSGLPKEEFEAWFLSYIPDSWWSDGCTALVLAPEVTEHGEVMMGRNYHGPYFALPWREIRRIEMEQEDVYALGCTHNWVGISDCLSSKGVFCFVSALHYPKFVPSPGIQWHILVEKAMWRCGRCEEVVGLLRSARHLRPLSYLVVDSAGSAAVVETSPVGSRVRGSKDGYLIVTNHMISNDGHIDPYPSKGSVRRYIRAEEMVLEGLRRGPADEGLIRSVLSDHEAGTCMGPHDPGSADPSSWGTLWAIIWRPSLDGFLLAPGHPCMTSFFYVSLR